MYRRLLSQKYKKYLKMEETNDNLAQIWVSQLFASPVLLFSSLIMASVATCLMLYGSNILLEIFGFGINVATMKVFIGGKVQSDIDGKYITTTISAVLAVIFREWFLCKLFFRVKPSFKSYKR